MEQRPPPPVTIEGGTGWQLDGPPRSAVGPGRPAHRARRPAVTLALALALGFVAGALATDLRLQVLPESDAGTLSFEARALGDRGVLDVGRTPEGRLATTLALDLRNTGPRTVGLRAVELPGTGYAADDVEGRRVRPGERSRVTLLRPVDCAARPGAVSAVPPLVVRAVTDAGPREQRLRTSLSPAQLSPETDRLACGEVAPEQALVVRESGLDFTAAAALVAVDVGNAGEGPLTVEGAQAGPGLAVRLLEPDGREVALPLVLPASDRPWPRPPLDVAGRTRALVAEVTVTSCDDLPARSEPYAGGTLVELQVIGGSAPGVPTAGLAYFGNRYPLLSRLRATGC